MPKCMHPIIGKIWLLLDKEKGLFNVINSLLPS